MFDTILKNTIEKFDLTEDSINDIVQFFKSMENKSEDLEKTMEKIGKKYFFENLPNLQTPTPYDTTNTLFFWRDSFQFPISIALDEEEIDSEFLQIISDEDIFYPFDHLDGLEYEDYCFDIYHSWIGFIYQKSKLFNSGLPMGITVNSDVVSYYFNDFSYQNHSKYSNINDRTIKVSRPFLRDLSLEEILIRSQVIKYPFEKIVLTSYLAGQKEIAILEGDKFKVSQIDIETEQVLVVNQGDRYKRVAGSDFDTLISYFESSINKKKEFNLCECLRK